RHAGGSTGPQRAGLIRAGRSFFKKKAPANGSPAPRFHRSGGRWKASELVAGAHEHLTAGVVVDVGAVPHPIELAVVLAVGLVREVDALERQRQVVGDVERSRGVDAERLGLA